VPVTYYEDTSSILPNRMGQDGTPTACQSTGQPARTGIESVKMGNGQSGLLPDGSPGDNQNDKKKKSTSHR